MWRHGYVVSAYIASLLYVTLSSPEVSYHVDIFMASRKIPVHVLAVGCKLSYSKFYGCFYSVYTGGKVHLQLTL